MLPRFFSVKAKDTLLDAMDPCISEAVLDTVLLSDDLDSSTGVVTLEPNLFGTGSEWLPNRPRNVLLRLLRRRGRPVDSGSEVRCTAEVDCDRGDGTLVLWRVGPVRLDRRERCAKSGGLWRQILVDAAKV